jgi:CHAD domain-containing protein
MSETEHALETAGVQSRPAPKSAPSRSLEDILVGQFELLRLQHAAVLESEDPNAIHKMRVTTRRIQASLDLLQGPNDTFGVRKQKSILRSARRILSLVRNYDVFVELLESDSNKRRSVRDPYNLLAEALGPRRQRRMAKARRYLLRFDIEGVARRVGVGSAPAVSSDSPPDPVSAPDSPENEGSVCQPTRIHVFDSRWIALHAADRLDQRLAEFHIRASQSHPTHDPTELHQLRIAAKRVRYLLELVSEMGYGDARSALNWLRSLQDRIGEWHDVEALEDEIVGIVTQRGFLKEHLAEAGILLDAASHLRKKKNQLIVKLFPVRVPRLLVSTGERLSRSLRRSAIQTAGARRGNRQKPSGAAVG